MGGLPCIRDLRFPVASVVAMAADGMTVEEILAEHPDLEADDIAECLCRCGRPISASPSCRVDLPSRL